MPLLLARRGCSRTDHSEALGASLVFLPSSRPQHFPFFFVSWSTKLWSGRSNSRWTGSKIILITWQLYPLSQQELYPNRVQIQRNKSHSNSRNWVQFLLACSPIRLSYGTCVSPVLILASTQVLRSPHLKLVHQETRPLKGRICLIILIQTLWNPMTHTDILTNYLQSCSEIRTD